MKFLTLSYIAATFNATKIRFMIISYSFKITDVNRTICINTLVIGDKEFEFDES